MFPQQTNPYPPSPSFNTSSSSPPPPPPPKPSRTSVRPSTSNAASNAAAPPPPPPPLPPPPDSTGRPNESSSKNAQPQPPPPNPSEHWLPEVLLDKPTSALSPLLTAQELLTALASTHPSLHPSPLPSRLTATAALAEHVLNSHERLLQLRHATQQHLLQLHGLERAWREVQQRMDAVLEPWSAKALYRRLGAAEREADEISRGVEDAFLDGTGGGGGGRGGDRNGNREDKATERELAEFCRRYREARGVVARRRESRERWDEGRVGGWR